MKIKVRAFVIYYRIVTFLCSKSINLSLSVYKTGVRFRILAETIARWHTKKFKHIFDAQKEIARRTTKDSTAKPQE